MIESQQVDAFKDPSLIQAMAKIQEHLRARSEVGFTYSVADFVKRLHQVNGQVVHQIGIPLHWGFTGLTRHGYLTNTLVPFLGDGNTQTPESKSFLVNVEKV